MFDKLSSTKPFMFNAYYEWMIKNEITPHLLSELRIVLVADCLEVK